MPPTKTRVVGSGYTVIEYAGKPIAFLESFADSGQTAYGAGFEAIYTLSANRAVEIRCGTSFPGCPDAGPSPMSGRPCAGTRTR
jgi:hypothetical protein